MGVRMMVDAQHTLWKDTSLSHWSQCWLFSQCVETDCIGCESGKLGDGCDSQDTTTEPPTTNAPGDTCPPLPDNGGHWTCFPETFPGQDVSDGTDCIFSCGETNSLHNCEGGFGIIQFPLAASVLLFHTLEGNFCVS